DAAGRRRHVGWLRLRRRSYCGETADMRTFALLLPSLLLAACGGSDSSNPPVIHVKDGDKEMNAAMEQSRATLDKFVAALQSPGPKQTDFSLKARFEEGSKVEHMWVNSLSVKGEGFAGKIGNEPEGLRKVKLGMPVTIPKERVSDWMFVEDGRLVGGYT